MALVNYNVKAHEVIGFSVRIYPVVDQRHRRHTAVLNGSCGVRPPGVHHTKGFSHREPYN